MNELILIHDKCNIVILISSNASPSKLIEVPMFTTRVLWSAFGSIQGDSINKTE